MTFRYILLMGVAWLCSFAAYANPTYYIQAAACHKQKCVNTYLEYIEQLGFPNQVKYTQQNKDRFRVLSRLTANKTAAQAYVDLINADKRVQVTAQLHQIDNRVYINLGEQANAQQAEWLKNFAVHLAKDDSLPANQLEFVIKHKIEQMFAIKILAGPFNDVEAAQQALQKIKSVQAFSRAFMTQN
ncbi:hypothetical protein DS2_11453 [Catenovulum agarivorans DS-2]|uniref:SPOR domain-containing protein n=1 Tax=Catenovulum agarivorans DS-2 TaxID=1328313 RepID=W7QWV0_9ALTE|nr:SPOR domain-containing protein [Catenovulum agarivorans]EWH09745.1 hypothetical protein DS2_11453 [Catenovulum agarivorans DS-2]